MVLLLVALGVDGTLASLVALVVRGFTLWLGVGIGDDDLDQSPPCGTKKTQKKRVSKR